MKRFYRGCYQRGNLSTDTAACPHIDKWIICRIEDVTCDDYIRAAEVDNAVAVGRCVRLVKGFDGLAIVKFSAPALGVRVGRPTFRWYGSHGAGCADPPARDFHLKAAAQWT